MSSSFTTMLTDQYVKETSIGDLYLEKQRLQREAEVDWWRRGIISWERQSNARHKLQTIQQQPQATSPLLPNVTN